MSMKKRGTPKKARSPWMKKRMHGVKRKLIRNRKKNRR